MQVLQDFTWQQFGWVAALLLVAWYGACWLLLYRRVPAGLGVRDKGPSLQVSSVVADAGDDLMGRAMVEEGVLSLPSDGFSFAGRSREEDLQGLVPDILEEVKQIVHTIEINGGDKKDFIALFKLVSAKYVRLKDSAHLEAVQIWISENVPFALTEDELWSLWD